MAWETRRAGAVRFEVNDLARYAHRLQGRRPASRARDRPTRWMRGKRGSGRAEQFTSRHADRPPRGCRRDLRPQLGRSEAMSVEAPGFDQYRSEAAWS